MRPPASRLSSLWGDVGWVSLRGCVWTEAGSRGGTDSRPVNMMDVHVKCEHSFHNSLQPAPPPPPSSQPLPFTLHLIGYDFPQWKKIKTEISHPERRGRREERRGEEKKEGQKEERTAQHEKRRGEEDRQSEERCNSYGGGESRCPGIVGDSIW